MLIAGVESKEGCKTGAGVASYVVILVDKRCE
jgi:hypothetical protein